MAVVFALSALASCSSGPPPAPPCAQNGAACDFDGQCCSQNCAGVCACDGLDIACTQSSQCCPGLTCTSGLCEQGCRADGAACGAASDCCSGTCSGGICGAPRCHQSGEPCGTSSDCCARLACSYKNDAYTCTTGCGLGGASCQNGPCCSGFQCNGSTCVSVCSQEGQACDAAAGIACCSGLTCNGSACVRCSGKNFTCTQSSDCCPGLSCTSGVCT